VLQHIFKLQTFPHHARPAAFYTCSRFSHRSPACVPWKLFGKLQSSSGKLGITLPQSVHKRYGERRINASETQQSDGKNCWRIALVLSYNSLVFIKVYFIPSRRLIFQYFVSLYGHYIFMLIMRLDYFKAVYRPQPQES